MPHATCYMLHATCYMLHATLPNSSRTQRVSAWTLASPRDTPWKANYHHRYYCHGYAQWDLFCCVLHLTLNLIWAPVHLHHTSSVGTVCAERNQQLHKQAGSLSSTQSHKKIWQLNIKAIWSSRPNANATLFPQPTTEITRGKLGGNTTNKRITWH